MHRRTSSGRRLLLSTLILVALSGISLVLVIHSIGQLLKAFDILYVLILLASLYTTVVVIYSVATIFYNVDKLSGRQRRTMPSLEFRSTRAEDRE